MNTNLCPTTAQANTTPASIACLITTFGYIVNAALIFIGSVTVFMIIFGGIKLITANGDAKQLEGARKTITFAIVGLVVVLFSFFIVNLIGIVTGVRINCFTVFGIDSCPALH